MKKGQYILPILLVFAIMMLVISNIYDANTSVVECKPKSTQVQLKSMDVRASLPYAKIVIRMNDYVSDEETFRTDKILSVDCDALPGVLHPICIGYKQPGIAEYNDNGGEKLFSKASSKCANHGNAIMGLWWAFHVFILISMIIIVINTSREIFLGIDNSNMWDIISSLLLVISFVFIIVYANLAHTMYDINCIFNSNTYEDIFQQIVDTSNYKVTDDTLDMECKARHTDSKDMVSWYITGSIGLVFSLVALMYSHGNQKSGNSNIVYKLIDDNIKSNFLETPMI